MPRRSRETSRLKRMAEMANKSNEGAGKIKNRISHIDRCTNIRQRERELGRRRTRRKRFSLRFPSPSPCADKLLIVINGASRWLPPVPDPYLPLLLLHEASAAREDAGSRIALVLCRRPGTSTFPCRAEELHDPLTQ